MKCPYCAEEINDAAIVCRYCHRDLHLIAPLTRKIGTLEQEVRELRQVVDAIVPTSNARSLSRGGATKRRIFLVSACVVIMGAVGSSICYWAFRHYESWMFLPMSIGFPSLSGLAAGLFLRGRHVKLYFLLGFFIGLIDFTTTIFIFQRHLWPLPDEWITISLFYVLGQSILFVLSGIIADWFETRFFHEQKSSQLSTRIATSLAGIRGGTPKDRIRDIEFWKSVLNALTPILALIGSIITAYFSYLSVLAKQ